MRLLTLLVCWPRLMPLAPDAFAPPEIIKRFPPPCAPMVEPPMVCRTEPAPARLTKLFEAPAFNPMVSDPFVTWPPLIIRREFPPPLSPTVTVPMLAQVDPVPLTTKELLDPVTPTTAAMPLIRPPEEISNTFCDPAEPT